jgi:hypothetical protein
VKPRTLVRRVTAVGVLALASVALAAVSASAKTSTPEKWGTTFCGSLTTWSDEVTERGDEIRTSLQGASISPTDGKALIVGYIGDIGDATGQFSTRMKKVGNPDATNGAKIQKTILRGIEGIETRVGDLETLAQSIPTTDLTSFQTSVQALAAAFDTVSQPFDQAMDKVAQLDEDNGLSGELEDLKACRALF